MLQLIRNILTNRWPHLNKPTEPEYDFANYTGWRLLDDEARERLRNI